MKPNLNPKIYGLIGYPVKHSLSPAMHSAAFRKLKVKGVYLLFETPGGGLEKTIDKIRLMDVAGFNVTLPYKEEIIPYLDRLDQQASRIGAVNTVLNKGGKLIGYNTDGSGFIASLKSGLKFNSKNKRIFILGAGGAARAIGFALAKEGARSIAFSDIKNERAKKLAGDISKIFDGCNTFVAPSVKHQAASIGEIDLLVNASSCGMKKNDPLPVEPKLLPKDAVVYDIIYNPSPTQLVKSVRARGIKAVNGLGMLLCQGALAFEIWTNKKAPLVSMRQALLRALHGKSG